MHMLNWQDGVIEITHRGQAGLQKIGVTSVVWTSQQIRHSPIWTKWQKSLKSTNMIRMIHWYMFQCAKWIQMVAQPTFYIGLQSCVRRLCWWIAKRPLTQWPPTWSTGPCNKRSSTWIKGAMRFGRRLRRQRVLQMTSSTLAFLGPGTACSRRLHREQVLDTEHAKLVLDKFGQTISPHPISL